MKFAYSIEIIPGDKSSTVRKTCEAPDIDHAWDIARKDAWKMAACARIVWVKDILPPS